MLACKKIGIFPLNFKSKEQFFKEIELLGYEREFNYFISFACKSKLLLIT